MGVSTSGLRLHAEQRNGASGLPPATRNDEALRRNYERSVRQLLDALEARLLRLPPEDRFAAIDAVAATVKDGRQVTLSVKPFTVRF
jgi:hypothetical protein